MKTLIAIGILMIAVLSGCGSGVTFTKSVPPLPWNVVDLKVMEIEDIKSGGYAGTGTFVRNVFIHELRRSGPVIIDDNSTNHLIVRIEDYNPSDKYIALSAQIVDISQKQIIWNASISGVGNKTIDEVTQTVVMEMVKAMSEGEKMD